MIRLGGGAWRRRWFRRCWWLWRWIKKGGIGGGGEGRRWFQSTEAALAVVVEHGRSLGG